MPLLKIQQNTVRALVTGDRAQKRTVEMAAAEFHPTIQPGNHSIVVNASSFYQSVTGQWYSDGSAIQAAWFDWRPVLCFDPSHRPFLWFRSWPYTYYPEKGTVWNGFALTRRGVQNGVINPAFNDNNEINNFLGFGITASRELVIYWVDGWDDHHEGYSPQGITKTQGFNAMIDAGVVHGGDGDYGGSLTVFLDGQLANNWYNDGKPMRPVWNHLCLEVTQLPGQVEPPDPNPEPEPSKDVIEVRLTYDDGITQDFVPKDSE